MTSISKLGKHSPQKDWTWTTWRKNNGNTHKATSAKELKTAVKQGFGATADELQRRRCELDELRTRLQAKRRRSGGSEPEAQAPAAEPAAAAPAAAPAPEGQAASAAATGAASGAAAPDASATAELARAARRRAAEAAAKPGDGNGGEPSSGP